MPISCKCLCYEIKIWLHLAQTASLYYCMTRWGDLDHHHTMPCTIDWWWNVRNVWKKGNWPTALPGAARPNSLLICHNLGLTTLSNCTNSSLIVEHNKIWFFLLYREISCFGSGDMQSGLCPGNEPQCLQSTVIPGQSLAFSNDHGRLCGVELCHRKVNSQKMLCLLCNIVISFDMPELTEVDTRNCQTSLKTSRFASF